MIRSLKPVALAFITAALVLSITRASAQDLPASTIKNIVLVHGAFADGSSFAKVIPILRAKGFNVVSVQNPLSSLADDVAATKRAIGLQPGPVVLVGHSWAGMVISQAGNDPKVKALVYISALIPQSGQSAATATKGYPATPGLSQFKADSGGWLWLTRKGVDEDFVPELSPDERDLVYVTQGPWNAKELNETVSHPAWMQKPSWEIVDANDRMVNPQYERDIAKKIHAKTTVLNSGHVPMLSMPQAVANVIIDAATNAK
ncbi:MAG TPA: alpha/beta hydrolase [Candidatus Tumulicola sp.]|jgi:pimeloyl-ACP methyl ester carboxylesterase